MKRREFLKYSACGLTAMALGPALMSCGGGGGGGGGPAAPLEPGVVSLGITRADVEMIDGRPVFHWLFGQDLDNTIRPSCPGPVIFHFEDEPLRINVRNDIADGTARGFAILGPPTAVEAFPILKESGPIPFGATGVFQLAPFEIPAGSYLYKDPSLDPLSRVMGLHGALIVLPAITKNPLLASTFPRPTPYSNPTPNVQLLFDDLGTGIPRDPHATFPGQPWFPTKDANPGYDPVGNESDHEHFMHFVVEAHGPRSRVFETFLYRNRVWVHSQIDPVLNEAVAAGAIPDPATVRGNFLPQYFNLNGRGGATSSHSPDVVPLGTVGEPHLIRLLNAGLAVHSPHLHANHVFIVSLNNVVGGAIHRGPAGDGMLAADALSPDNVPLLDTMTLGSWKTTPFSGPAMSPANCC